MLFQDKSFNDPRRAVQLGLGVASPLWPTFIAAAGVGMAYWAWSQFARGRAQSEFAGAPVSLLDASAPPAATGATPPADVPQAEPEPAAVEAAAVEAAPVEEIAASEPPAVLTAPVEQQLEQILSAPTPAPVPLAAAKPRSPRKPRTEVAAAPLMDAAPAQPASEAEPAPPTAEVTSAKVPRPKASAAAGRTAKVKGAASPAPRRRPRG